MLVIYWQWVNASKLSKVRRLSPITYPTWTKCVRLLRWTAGSDRSQYNACKLSIFSHMWGCVMRKSPSPRRLGKSLIDIWVPYTRSDLFGVGVSWGWNYTRHLPVEHRSCWWKRDTGRKTLSSIAWTCFIIWLKGSYFVRLVRCVLANGFCCYLVPVREKI